MPPELMGVLDNGSNRSTVNATGAIFGEWVVGSERSRWKNT